VPVPPALRPRSRSAAALTLAVVTCVTLVACGDDEPGAADRLAERASSGLDQSYVTTYALTSEGLAEPATVQVWHTPATLRLDLETTSGVATSLTSADGVVSCQQPVKGESTCLQVAGPGEEPPDALDPALRDLFSGMLVVFADDGADLDVSEVDDDAEPVAEVPGEDVACFEVVGDPPAPVSPGTYCLSPDGVPTAAVFTSGQLTLTDLAAEPPVDADFEPPASPAPLPTT
jgi:hypothetical protein